MNYQKVLEFWFGQDPKKWFNGWELFDRKVTEEFSDLYETVISWKQDDYLRDAKSSLALVIVLDQFSRNMFRWSPRAFEYDFMALYITKFALKKGFLEQLEWAEKTFLIMPLMHSESLPDQDICIQVFSDLAKLDDMYTANVEFAHAHRDIILKFGRFPHRNRILWRVSTSEEEIFLKEHSGF